jgi:RNA polymerase sigma-70 factor (ECF subfamily)
MEVSTSMSESGDTLRLLAAIAAGKLHAVDELLATHRPYLRRLIQMRIQPQLQARIDPSDIVQETLLVASQGIDDFIKARPALFRIWLRGLALHRLFDAQRRHLSLKRDARREMSMNDDSSTAIYVALMGNSPSEHAMRCELIDQIRFSLSTLAEADRDVLLMRHGELLNIAEIGDALGISADAASKRYGRAAVRLHSALRRDGIIHR